jgi:hypothetical protein
MGITSENFMMEMAWWAMTVGEATRTPLAIIGGGGWCRRRR